MGAIAMSGRAAVVGMIFFQRELAQTVLIDRSITVIVVMRTYALLNCNLKVLLLVGSLGLTTIVVDGVSGQLIS